LAVPSVPLLADRASVGANGAAEPARIVVANATDRTLSRLLGIPLRLTNARPRYILRWDVATHAALSLLAHRQFTITPALAEGAILIT
jgi:hypothetical protein